MVVPLGLGAIVAIILGILTALGIISFSWSVVERNNTIQQGEKTEQDAAAALRDIVNNKDLPEEIRNKAAQALIDLAGEAPIHEDPSPDDGGLFGKADVSTLVIGAALLLALSRK